jgi:hypothetical protein
LEYEIVGQSKSTANSPEHLLSQKKEEKEKTTNYLVISHHYSKPYNSRRLLIQLPLGLHQTNAPANPTSPSPGTNDPQVNTPKNCGECR